MELTNQITWDSNFESEQMDKNNKKLTVTFQTEKNRILNYIKAKVQDFEDSEDILQDVFISATENLDSLSIIDNISAWLFEMARNKIIDLYRKKSVRNDYLEKLQKQIDSSFLSNKNDNVFDSERINSEIEKKIQKAIEELPDKYKKLVIQRLVHKKKFREIAKESGKSIYTIQSQVNKAILLLQNKLHDLKDLL